MNMLALFKTLLDQKYDSTLSEHANDITVLGEILNGLIESGISGIDNYQVVLKEESAFEQLTAANTIPGVLYFGLEPLDDEGTESLTYDNGYISFNANYDNGWISNSAATYDNGWVAI